VLKARKSLGAAASKLKRAKELLADGHHDAALLYAYTSMFSSGRALLYRDGVQEKSHYCLARYLEEKYVKKGKLDPEIIVFLDSFREERHAIMYGFEEVEIRPEAAREAVSIAEEFLRRAKGLVSRKRHAR
jgi:uncharacterized protein (UPF0332 family)